MIRVPRLTIFMDNQILLFKSILILTTTVTVLDESVTMIIKEIDIVCFFLFDITINIKYLETFMLQMLSPLFYCSIDIRYMTHTKVQFHYINITNFECAYF